MALSRSEALEWGSVRATPLLDRRVSMKETPAIFHSDSTVAN